MTDSVGAAIFDVDATRPGLPPNQRRIRLRPASIPALLPRHPPPASAGLRITEIASFVAVPGITPAEGERLPHRPDQRQAIRRLRCSPDGAARKPGPQSDLSVGEENKRDDKPDRRRPSTASPRRGRASRLARGEPSARQPVGRLADSEPAGFSGRPILPCTPWLAHMFVVAMAREPGSARRARVHPRSARPAADSEPEQV